MNRDQLREARNHPNVNAFLRVLREGESSQDDSAFTVCYGGSHFAAPPWDHPRKPIKAGAWTSTAAGAFQFLQRTWDGLVKQYGFEDFSPDCQTEAAIALIAGRKALADVIAGRFDQAIAKCNKEWASLPGSPYGQPVMTMKQARMVYEAWGGSVLETGTTVPKSETPTQEPPMLPFLAAAIPALLSAAPDLIRLFGHGPMSERNAVVAQKVAEVAIQVTGAVNEQEAAKKIETDPEAAEAFRRAVADNFDQWMGMMVKFREMDEASKAKARDFVLSYGREPVAGKFTFVEVLSIFMLVIAAVGGGFVLWDPRNQFTSEMQTAVVMLMLIGGWNGVKEFWLGSSMGSMRKDDRQATNQPAKE